MRGAVGLALLVASLALLPAVGPLSLLLLVPAGVVLRGCPTCWALGLMQTVALQRAGPGESMPPGDLRSRDRGVTPGARG